MESGFLQALTHYLVLFKVVSDDLLELSTRRRDSEFWCADCPFKFVLIV